MAETRAAYRYALALIGIAEEIGQLDPISEDFAMLGKAMRDSHDLYRFFKSPVINKHKKRVVLDALLKDKVNETTYRFIELITMKERESILPEIIVEFSRLRDKRLGIIRASVKSAVPLSRLQVDDLLKRLGAVTGKKLMFTESVDPALIGGLTVQYEDTVWDGSVRRQLDLLRERFLAGTSR